ncbi:hypothetical protein [Nocardioides luteus]|uniref:Uncharacterized protein n=1 Tax=Nocardioides luteus TaxID=1844 RepID=A0A1J4MZ67_9ACTN|nr:hypothetical protein [Nocardioides luteus]OIJ23568.1 hypothetical protein UG56_027270 [Nocardioides luteus]
MGDAADEVLSVGEDRRPGVDDDPEIKPDLCKSGQSPHPRLRGESWEVMASMIFPSMNAFRDAFGLTSDHRLLVSSAGAQTRSKNAGPRPVDVLAPQPLDTGAWL